MNVRERAVAVSVVEGGKQVRSRRKCLARLALGAAISFAVPAGAQDVQFTIFPSTRMCTDPIPHSTIFFRTVNLTAGTTAHFLTAGTFSGWFGHPDPVMLIISPSGTVAGFNDDFVGLDADIVFTPPVTGAYRLIVFAAATATPGFTNVLFSVNGGPPTTLAAAVKFGGTRVLTDWNPGIRFVTAGGNGDTVLLLFGGGSAIGSPVAFNDDVVTPPSIPGIPMGPLNSSITPSFSAHGGATDNPGTSAVVGSFSPAVEGETSLCQLFRSWMDPLLSPPHAAPRPAPVPNTPTMTRYLKEYLDLKPKLVQMNEKDRERAILELQRRILPEEEIRLFSAPVSFPTAAYVRAQDEYLARVHEREGELSKLGHAERAATLEKMKAETVGRALLQVQPDYGIPLEGDQGTAERRAEK